MKSTYTFLSLLLISSCSLAQKPEQKCNRSVSYNRLKSKLDSSICLPKGYHITDIYDKNDLNSDGRNDKIIKWQKIEIIDGDTILYSMYAKQKDSTFSFFRTFRNLEPLYFTNYDVPTGDKILDSVKSIYFYPGRTIVEFETNTIKVTLYTEPVAFKELYFTYSPKEMTWILTREKQWLVPPKNYEGDEKLDENGRKLEYDRAPDQPMRVEDFDMLKYIDW